MIGLLVPSTAHAQFGSSAPPCADADFNYQVGVYLPPGSPDVQLTVRPYDGEAVLYQGLLKPGETTDDAAKCNWGAYVGTTAPLDPLVVSLPANVPLRFEFSPASSFYNAFEYQLCRGDKAPYGSFRCPQNAATAAPDDSHTLFRYDSNYGGGSAIRVRTGPFGDQIGESVDDELGGEQWVLPYDAEFGCTQLACGSDIGLGTLPLCNPSETEETMPYMRRLVVGGSFPGLETNGGVRWVIRDDQDVSWTDLNTPSPNFGFRGGACVDVEGDLNVAGLGLTAEEPNSRWRGISVLGSGSLTLKDVGLSFTGGPLGASIPFRGAIRSSSSNATINIRNSAVADNTTDGVYVGGGASLVADGLLSLRNDAGGSPSDAPAGAWVADGASALLLNSSTRLNQGSGVRVSGSGSYANLDEHLSESNEGFGVQADDAGEVFFARTDTGDPNPTATSTIRDNEAGSLAAFSGGDVIAGISDGTTCMRFCKNNILGGDNVGGVDVRAQGGSVVFAEADFWGHLTEAELILNEDATNAIYVQPLLQQPPSARGGPFAPLASKGGDLRHSPAARVRALAALGDAEAAAEALREAWRGIELAGDREAVFSAATVLAARSPGVVLPWLRDLATVPSEGQRWAQHALLAGLIADRQSGAAWTLAETLAEGDDRHARGAMLALVRLAVAAGDADRSALMLERIERRYLDTTEAERARALVVASFPGAAARPRAKTLTPVMQAAADTRIASSTLSVYPNPTTDRATLEFQLDDQANVTVALYDLAGRRVAWQDLGHVTDGAHGVTLDLGTLPAGVYVARVTMSGARDTVEAVRITVAR